MTATTQQPRRSVDFAGGRRNGAPIVFLLVLLLRLVPLCTALSALPPLSPAGQAVPHVSFTYTVVMIAVSALLLLCMLTFSFRSCIDEAERLADDLDVNSLPSWRPAGLSPEVLAAFPTMTYSEAKTFGTGAGALECAVCLSEFQEEEMLRLLPGCCHVFHPDCIDPWLVDHVTCPICRTNVAAAAAEEGLIAEHPDPPFSSATSSAVSALEDHEIFVDSDPTLEDSPPELPDLVRNRSERTEARNESMSLTTPFYSLSSENLSAQSDALESIDRYTLRLPEHVRRQIFAARSFGRSVSCAVFQTTGGSSMDGSSRQGGIRRWVWSMRQGLSEQWSPSFLLRLSMAFSPWKARDGAESSGTRGRRGERRRAGSRS
ncbi:RING-H2 finger protein ATL38-like [Zingiber officinale]|uniref:RING-type E3 ubiquitin transferase n=1 Tax=Zingiber officinale TaxID=94328 RepID=A0A8J5M359_ZINOF|nr:RING-H2 finger protein ATL38-like [Zingiber officinale]KAG6533036.1 hypothetical protein ZIOFF_006897 [Zingiber officinale]